MLGVALILRGCGLGVATRRGEQRIVHGCSSKTEDLIECPSVAARPKHVGVDNSIQRQGRNVPEI